MRTLFVGVILLCVAAPVNGGQGSDAKAEVEGLVREYTRLEDAGDMQGQARLMAPDRFYCSVGGCRTNNALWMQVQEEDMATFRRAFPGVKRFTEIRDLRTRTIGNNVAITTFTWFIDRVVPLDIPAEKMKALGPDPIPLTVTLVWAKQDGAWRIVSTHNSPLYLRQ